MTTTGHRSARPCRRSCFQFSGRWRGTVTRAEKKHLEAKARKELQQLFASVNDMRDVICELLPDDIAVARQLSEAAMNIRYATIILNR